MPFILFMPIVPSAGLKFMMHHGKIFTEGILRNLG